MAAEVGLDKVAPTLPGKPPSLARADVGERSALVKGGDLFFSPLFDESLWYVRQTLWCVRRELGSDRFLVKNKKGTKKKNQTEPLS